MKYEEYLNSRSFTKNGEDVLYRLDAVACHIGAACSGVHYVAAVRESDGDNFVHANDDIRVSRTSYGKGTFIKLQTPTNFGSKDVDPYILFYSKM